MSKRALLGIVAVTALGVTSPAMAASTPSTQSKSVTATGTGQAPVKPANRHNNASIVAAVDSAHLKSISGAMSQAHEYATDYAQAASLTLGDVLSVSDVQNNGFYGPGPFFGPFGVNQYCGTIEVPVGRPVKGHRRKFHKVHRCFVPPFAFTTLTVTYSAS